MPAEAVFDCCLSLAQDAEKFCNEVFELQIAEDLRVIVLVEDKLEILIVDDLLNFADEVFKVDALEFKAELKILIVEDTDVGLRVVFEYLSLIHI